MGLGVWEWFSIACGLVIFELVIGANFFLLWVGLWAFVLAGVNALFPNLSWLTQVALFAIGSFMSLWVAWKRFKQYGTAKPNLLNKRGTQYLHQEFLLLEPIQNGRGRLEIDSTIWRIYGPDVPSGSRVRVAAVEGAILRVEPL